MKGGGLKLEQAGNILLEPDEAAQEGLDNLENGPTYIVGSHNREWGKALTQMERKAAVEALSDYSM